MLEPISVILVWEHQPNPSTIALLLAAPPQKEDLIFFEPGDVRLPDILAQKYEPIVFKVVQVRHRVWPSRSASIEMKVIRVTNW
jgi:hypothetical protein